MPQDPDLDEDLEEYDPDAEPDPEPERFVKMSRKDIRALERRAKKAEDAEKETAALRRERAFEKAKVDTSKPLGEHFAKHYDGDLEPDKIREEAERLGVPFTEAKAPEGPDLEPGEEKSTEERESLATGGKPDSGEETKPEPLDAARKVGEDAIKEGRGEEDALAAGIGTLAGAAEAGDSRAVWTP